MSAKDEPTILIAPQFVSPSDQRVHDNTNIDKLTIALEFHWRDRSQRSLRDLEKVPIVYPAAACFESCGAEEKIY